MKREVERKRRRGKVISASTDSSDELSVTRSFSPSDIQSRLGIGDLHLLTIFVDSFQTEFDCKEVVAILRGDAQTSIGLRRGGKSSIRQG